VGEGSGFETNICIGQLVFWEKLLAFGGRKGVFEKSFEFMSKEGFEGVSGR